MRAAGCVVWRAGAGDVDEPEVLVVHRPRWDDWSFPKGKINRGERSIAAATREVAEETGLRVRLGPRMRDDHYTISTGQPKVVSYWIARPPRHSDVSGYEPNSEIDRVEWMSLSKARTTLTYPRDVEMLQEFHVTAFDSTALIIVRHAEARKRRTWRRDDRVRPLSAEGRRAAQRLVPIFAAYGITRIITSDALRCQETMKPFASAYDVKLKLEPRLSEEKVTDKALAKLAKKALESNKRMVICTHRPVLPRLCAALGISDVALEPGSLLAVHRAHGRVLSVEKPE